MKVLKVSLFILGLVLAGCSSDSGGGDGGGNGGLGGANNGGTNGPGGNKGGAPVSFNGTWKGNGELVTQGQTIPCQDVVFEYQQTANSIKVVRGDFNCDQGVTYNWDQQEEVEIEGTNLKAQGQVVGTFSGSVLEVKNGTYSLKIQRNGSNMTVNEADTANNFKATANLTLQ